MLHCLAGWDAKDTTSLSTPVPDYLAALEGVSGARGARIGIDWDYAGTELESATLRCIEEAVEVLGSIGADLRTVAFPAVDTLLRYTMVMTMAEMAVHHEATYPSEAHRYGGWIAKGMEAGRAASSLEIGKGIIARAAFRGALARLFDEIEMIVVPVFRTGTPTWTEVRAAVAEDFNIIGKFTTPFNATGTPTVTLPCGFTADGRPIAFQLAGPAGSEAQLLRVAHAYQQATDWHTRRPPLP